MLKGLLFSSLFLSSTFSYADMSPQARADLIRKYAPLVKLHSHEDYFPSSVPWFLNQSALVKKNPETQKNETVQDGLKSADLTRLQGDFITPQGKSSDIARVFRGEELNGKEVQAPCYVNLVEKPNGAVIQYLFFYPFNGEILGVLEGIDKLFNTKIGAHQGDWEHIDVHVTKDDRGGYRVSTLYYARHRASQDGSYYDPNEVKFYEDTHPIVYASLRGHASYPRPFTINGKLDQTSDHGASWRTWERDRLVDVGSVAQPTPGNEWIQFRGTWGEKGPATPSHQGWWRNAALQYVSPLTIPVIYDKHLRKMSKNFKLKGKFPTYVRKLNWRANHPQAGQITFNVNKDTFGPDQMTVYGPLRGDGNILPIEHNKITKLYISNLRLNGKVMKESDAKDLQIVIEGVED